jgi:hypothetical protein
MSVQVSYRKQLLFFLLLGIIFFMVLEISLKQIIPSYEIKSCVSYLNKSHVGLDVSKKEYEKICEKYSELISINTQDGYYAYLFPNQKLDIVNINNIGLRGVDINQKQIDTYRILMVGGSTTFGSKAPSDNDTIPKYLENILNFKYDQKFEVINAGIGGASSYHEINLIYDKLLKLEPDMIIVYDGWNDLQNIHIPSDMKSAEYALDNHILIKKIESIFYLPTAIKIIEHKISSELFLLNTGKINVITSLETEEEFALKSKSWSTRWNNFCSNDNVFSTTIFLQPILGTGDKKFSKFEKQLLDNPNVNLLSNFYYLMERELSNIENCNTYDISKVFDNHPIPIYFDYGHTFVEGNKIIAQTIEEKISENLLNQGIT